MFATISHFVTKIVPWKTSLSRETTESDDDSAVGEETSPAVEAELNDTIHDAPGTDEHFSSDSQVNRETHQVDDYDMGSVVFSEQSDNLQLDEHQKALIQGPDFHTKAGLLLYKQGDFLGSLRELQKALEATILLDPKSVHVASCHIRIGAVRCQLGDLKGELLAARAALHIQLCLAPESLPAATSYFKIGVVLSRQGHLRQALNNHRVALKIRRKHAAQSLEEAESLAHIGCLLDKLGDVKGAGSNYKQALGIQRQLAPNDMETATLNIKVGSVVFRQGYLEAALKFYTDGLAIIERMEPDSPSLAKLYVRIGIVCHKQGDMKKAAYNYQKALARYEQNDSTQHVTKMQNNIDFLSLEASKDDRSHATTVSSTPVEAAPLPAIDGDSLLDDKQAPSSTPAAASSASSQHVTITPSSADMISLKASKDDESHAMTVSSTSVEAAPLPAIDGDPLLDDKQAPLDQSSSTPAAASSASLQHVTITQRSAAMISLKASKDDKSHTTTVSSTPVEVAPLPAINGDSLLKDKQAPLDPSSSTPAAASSASLQHVTITQSSADMISLKASKDDKSHTTTVSSTPVEAAPLPAIDGDSLLDDKQAPSSTAAAASSVSLQHVTIMRSSADMISLKASKDDKSHAMTVSSTSVEAALLRAIDGDPLLDDKQAPLDQSSSTPAAASSASSQHVTITPSSADMISLKASKDDESHAMTVSSTSVEAAPLPAIDGDPLLDDKQAPLDQSSSTPAAASSASLQHVTITQSSAAMISLKASKDDKSHTTTVSSTPVEVAPLPAINGDSLLKDKQAPLDPSSSTPAAASSASSQHVTKMRNNVVLLSLKGSKHERSHATTVCSTLVEAAPLPAISLLEDQNEEDNQQAMDQSSSTSTAAGSASLPMSTMAPLELRKSRRRPQQVPAKFASGDFVVDATAHFSGLEAFRTPVTVVDKALASQERKVPSDALPSTMALSGELRENKRRRTIADKLSRDNVLVEMVNVADHGIVHSKWSSRDDSILRTKKAHGLGFKQISEFLPGRSVSECWHRFDYLSRQPKTAQANNDPLSSIEKVSAQPSESCYESVSEEVPKAKRHKTPSFQVSKDDAFVSTTNALSSQGYAGPEWTEADDALLKERRACGLTWPRISTLFPGQSSRACYNRHRKIARSKRLDGQRVWVAPECGFKRVCNSAVSLESKDEQWNYQDDEPPKSKRQRTLPLQVSKDDALIAASGPAPHEWTEADDALLKERRARGLTWPQIATLFPGRSTSACSSRHRKITQPNSVAGQRIWVAPEWYSRPVNKSVVLPKSNNKRWTLEEDAIIREKKACTELSWEEIATLVSGRSGKDCRQRYYELTKPKAVLPEKRRAFTLEDLRLVRQYHPDKLPRRL